MPFLLRFLRRPLWCVLLAWWALGGFAQQKTSAAQAAPPIRFEDVTTSAKIRFQHAVSPEKKYLIESMSGGVMLLDYDQDGWLDIYFTNAPSVEQGKRGEKVRSALYHNNHDGTF